MTWLVAILAVWTVVKVSGWVVDGFWLGMVLGPIGWLAAFLGAKDDEHI